MYLLLFSCGKSTSNKIETVFINPDDAEKIQLSSFIDSVKYIKLQTDSTCLTGVISDIMIKEKYIYINDMSKNSILIFDKQGKFISSLDKKGKGEGEYMMISAFTVDSSEHYITILDGIKNKLLTYTNLNFSFVKEESAYHISSNTVKWHEGFLYHSTHRLDNIIDSTTKESTNADVIVCKGNKLVKTLFPKKIFTNNNYYSVYPESFIINDKNELFASIMFDNSFYKIKQLEAIPILKVNFTGKGIDNNEISLSSTEEQIKFISSPTNYGKAMLPFLTINNDNILSFSYCVNIGKDANDEYSFPIEFRNYIYFKKSRKSFHAKNIINDITEFPETLWMMNFNKSATVYEPWYKDYLVYIVSPSRELLNADEIKTKSIGTVKIDDNPIIMLLKPKVF
jgi:hypothetical protein